MGAVVHKAGPMERSGLQHCDLCGYVLTDYRHAMVPDGDPPLRGWQVGASIEVGGGNPHYSVVTPDPPNCVSEGEVA